MKPKVLLAGGTGYIGKYLSEVIENDAELFTISKYPDNKKTDDVEMTWIQCDIFHYEQVVAKNESNRYCCILYRPNKEFCQNNTIISKRFNINHDR